MDVFQTSPMIDKRRDYELLQSEEDQGSRVDRSNFTKQGSFRDKSFALFVVSVVTLILSILILAVALTRTPSQLECAKVVSPYSPLWAAVDFWEGDFENDFFHKTVYRGPPTSEREQAWDDLWNNGLIGVPPAGVIALNKTKPSHHKTIDTGSGEEYGAMVEVFHQLHCLNLIRQYTWLDQYDPKDKSIPFPKDLKGEGVDPLMAREHVDHCIETLRLSLMCYGDVTPLFFDLDSHEKIGRKADFNVHHKCRNFDSIVNFVRANSIRLDFSLVHSHNENT